MEGEPDFLPGNYRTYFTNKKRNLKGERRPQVKFFICALDEMILGIPSEGTARIISAPRTQTVLYEIEKEELFISLPVLFRKDALPAPHGMILKEKCPPHTAVTLLVPRIETDIDIPEAEIQKLPALIGEKLSCLGGAYFNKEGLILLLDTKKLVKTLQGVHHD
jgi:hypothetical protein